MSDKVVKKFMSSVAFAQHALRDRIAPASIGSIKARIRHASRKLGWTDSRTRECWYARQRVRISADELTKIEEITGLRYGQQELRSIETIIARADTLLDGPEADFFRPFVAALRAMAGFADRAGTEG